MLKYLISTAALFVMSCGISTAAELKGQFKSVSTDKTTITITVADKDQTLSVAKDAEVYSLGKGKKGAPGPKVTVSGGLGSLKAGSEVTVTTETKDDKEVATAIQVAAETKKKKKVK